MGGRQTTGEKHLNEQNKCFDFNSCHFAEQRSREASQQAETFVLTFQLHMWAAPDGSKTFTLCYPQTAQSHACLLLLPSEYICHLLQENSWSA